MSKYLVPCPKSQSMYNLQKLYVHACGYKQQGVGERVLQGIGYDKSEIFTHDCPQFFGKYIRAISFNDSSIQAI